MSSGKTVHDIEHELYAAGDKEGFQALRAYLRETADAYAELRHLRRGIDRLNRVFEAAAAILAGPHASTPEAAVAEAERLVELVYRGR